MKKTRILLILLSVPVLLCSCKAQPEEVSRAESYEAVSTDSGETERLAQLEATVAQLQAELASCEQTIADLKEHAGRLTDKRIELADELAKEQENAKELRAQIDDLQEKLSKKPTDTVLQEFWIDGGTLYHVQDESYQNKLYIQHDDGTVTNIHEDVYISYLRLSHDRTKVIWSDFEWEVNATVRIYDLESGELTVRAMDDLGANQTPSFMDWLDDRYFLFVVQFDQGTIALGGDVYVYDTQTDEYRKIIGRDTNLLMVTSFKRRWQNSSSPAPFLFSASLYDEEYADHTELYYRLTVQELYDLIENGKTVTFEAANGF